MRIVALAFFVLAAACGPSFAEEAPADLLTKAERKDVEAVIASMLAAGFPDAEKATVYSGPLSVKANFDPSKEPPPLPSSASGMQMTSPGSTNMTYGYEFDGLHFKLADGTWVIALAYTFEPKPDDDVDASNATEVDLAALTASAAASHPFSTDKDAAGFLEGFAPAQRERSKAEMDRLIPVTRLLKLGPDLLPQAAVLLHRAGWSDAAALSLMIADQRARNYWQLRPWTTPDPPFDATNAYPGAKDEEAAWKKAHAQVASEKPHEALRRALFRWCRAQMTAEEPEDVMLPLDAAAAATKAALDPKDPQKYAARIDALLAGMKLPVSPAEGADLPTRLASWEARQRMPRMLVAGGGGGDEEGTLSFSTGFTAPMPAYVPEKADLDALIALLADERPSRFFDFNGARTLGDNAWRAVAALLKADPRTLAGHPTDKAWTASERKAAATAVQKWWKLHRTEYVDK